MTAGNLFSVQKSLRADLAAQTQDDGGFPEAYLGSDVDVQWCVRRILMVPEHHHLDEVMVAWDDATLQQRSEVLVTLGLK
jgi:hypothetical protein